MALADTKPNGLSFATQGLGAGGQILGEQFSKASGKNMLAIPYKGGGPALLDTSAGRTDFMFSGLAPVRSFLADGTLRILAVAGPDRLSILPDVKSMGELGYPDVNLNFWMAVFAPAGTPEGTGYGCQFRSNDGIGQQERHAASCQWPRSARRTDQGRFSGSGRTSKRRRFEKIVPEQ